MVAIWRSAARLVTQLPTALDKKVKQSVAAVRPSVDLSVRLFPLYLLNRLTFELEILCVCVCVRVCVMTTARLGLKVKLISQGQRSVSSAYDRDNEVTRSA